MLEVSTRQGGIFKFRGGGLALESRQTQEVTMSHANAIRANEYEVERASRSGRQAGMRLCLDQSNGRGGIEI